ncbi:unnamed protein product [Adineta ricciae]|uniref:Uncharacterized protein n=1 Tax=Adineta ricciae TaxID=249248 RepID=A0A814AJX1_ADIRI|nr:unnamed protein product [Adineta ricciae]
MLIGSVQAAFLTFAAILIQTTKHIHCDTTSSNVYNLDSQIVIQQNMIQKGLVIMEGKLTKPFTNDHIKLSINYQNIQGSWMVGWCKTLYSYNQYNENIELSSNTNLSSFSSVVWDKTISHFKLGDYTGINCDLDENEYTILLTPKKRWLSTGYSLDNKKNDVIFSPTNPAILLTDTNGAKSIKMVNQGTAGDILGSTPEFIYNVGPGHPIPYLYSYTDPVYMFAGKFSVNGFFIKFSQWPGEPNGPGYHNFKNPNSLQSRYFNLYNTINEKLSGFITDQEPVVFVSSVTTGFRVYKSNGTYVTLTGYSNYGALFFGYGNDQGGGRRGPGSENFIVSNTSEMTLYGMGALRNNFVSFTPGYPSIRSIQDIEKEISKFIKYTGIFGNSIAYDDTSECAAGCFAANSGAVSDYVVLDWTRAPNSYIFTGKDKSGNDADGIYIPVKKAYEMWSKGGEFMKDENGNYTPIPSGIAKAGLYWEDEPGLVKSITLEGTGENAKIKVLLNKLKEGNAVVSYRVNDIVYWTWHVWVTDDPTVNGSTYRLGFEKDKNGNLATDWKWMDRNLGATSANFLGNNWHKSQGLQYQWGRKDPFPALMHKDGTMYEISGEIGNIRNVGAVYTTGSTSALPVKYRGNLYLQDNTGYDTPNGNIRYSVQNPIHMIIPPLYVKKYNDTVFNNGEDMFVQNSAKGWYHQKRTTWFSKQKYRNDFNSVDPSQNVAWDLWGDTRGGKISDLNNPQLAEESKRYAMKSPYDPCPCNWRVPSYYDNIGSPNNDNNASPWGRIGGANDVDTFTSNTSTSSTRFPGIKIYPGLGYDFTGVTGRNLGLIPINGNYEYYPNYVTVTSVTASGLVIPKIVYQDGSADGALGSSTFSVGAAGSGPWYGPRGLGYVSDPANVQETANNFGWYTMNSLSHDGNTHETVGIRCIKDPNNAYMPTAFETEFISSSNEEYALSTLNAWTKEPNSYVEYTNNSLITQTPADKDRVIEIPLRKAYAMYKLHLSTTGEYPQGSIKSTSVVWTTNIGLIQNVQIIDGTKETAKLIVTLNENQYGNAVVAFHLGNSGQWVNGKMQDPIIWSWHIWAPETIVGSLDYETETSTNGGIINASNTAFVNPVKSIGVPLKTSFMDRDLGALMMFPEEASAGDASYIYSFVPQISKSGGLHFQWGRKDPLPVFINAGGHYDFGSAIGSQGSIYKNMARYTIRVQSGPISNGIIPYSGTIDSASYATNYAKEFSTDYSSVFAPADSKKDKIKKVLMYSVKNPLYFLYQNPSNETNQFKKVRDWISDENGQFTDRWGHGTEKSPFDPCPQGWRIPDTFYASMHATLPKLSNFYSYWALSSGNNPWYYNGYQASGTGKYGLFPSAGYSAKRDAYSPANQFYPGSVSLIYNYPATRFGFVLNNNRYKIGNYANNGIRGFQGGKDLTLVTIDGTSRLRFNISGVWTASPTDVYSGTAIGLLFNIDSSSEFIMQTGYPYYPQAAMSCRCAKIKYDGNGSEIGRYEPTAIEVPKNATA